ncbi:MAG: hypothetical protein IPI58_03770 [Alphaproteobacteria bacterium]|nr:MAG: hypothetical protein IPI58_03770 [Alphaproteobacteria bacterium]
MAQEWAQKAREIHDSDGFILYCQPGEVLRGALVEAGMAMAFQKRIACVGSCDATLGGPTQATYTYSPLWVAFDSLKDAFLSFGITLPQGLPIPEQTRLTA